MPNALKKSIADLQTTLANIYRSTHKVSENCVNCGAAWHGIRCEYCGTEYQHAQRT